MAVLLYVPKHLEVAVAKPIHQQGKLLLCVCQDLLIYVVQGVFPQVLVEDVDSLRPFYQASQTLVYLLCILYLEFLILDVLFYFFELLLADGLEFELTNFRKEVLV